MRLNTNIPGAILIISDEVDRQGSPRTHAAYKFQGLQLEDGETVSKLELPKPKPIPKSKDESAAEEIAVRKRLKVLGGAQDRYLIGKIKSNGTIEIPETPDKRTFKVIIGPERTVDPILRGKARDLVLQNEVDPIIFKGSSVGQVQSGGLARAYPSINRLSDSKSRVPKPKKRTGTPPLFGSADATLELDATEKRTVVDEERAALTWHDDEITGHNSEDPDDDGEGINGIGFKPTPAMAYARTEKRRQQILEYKTREAKEARAKRSERRRASEASKSSKEEEETARRVRFLEAEVKNAIPTS